MQVPQILFKHTIVDSDAPKSPHIKAVGDLTGNGLTDIIIPSSAGGPLVWYEAPGWERFEICPSGRWSCEAQIVDMNGNGYNDILISEWYNENRMEWFENPLPHGDPRKDPWKRHIIGSPRAHNIERADLDGDGHMELVTRDQGKNGGKILVWKRVDDQWRQREIECPLGEGLHVADINGDGKPEIVIGGLWYETPMDVMQGTFKEHQFVKGWAGDAIVRCADMNGNGRLDVVLARTEGPGHLSWFEAPTDPAVENWREHVVMDPMDFVHSLRVCDLNGNGKPDIVAAEMHQSERKRVMVFVNQGDSIIWSPQVLSEKGSHCMCVCDTTGDGYPDIIGVNWGGDYQPVELWANLSGR